MPILDLEPFVCPNDLFLVSSPSSTRHWWVVHTRTRSEKALARRLSRTSSDFFLPLFKKQCRTETRLQTTYLPLFPGYVFLRGEDSRSRALETNLVARCLPVADQDRLQADLTGIHRLMTADVPITPEQNLAVGTRVEVIEGPFAGLVGKLIKKGSQSHFVVEVRMLNQGVSVELESWMVRPVSSDDTRPEEVPLELRVEPRVVRPPRRSPEV